MRKRDFLPVALVLMAVPGMAQEQTPSNLPTFDQVDADADGTVTPAEVNAALQGYDFASADLDGNELLTRDEYDMGIQRQTGREEGAAP